MQKSLKNLQNSPGLKNTTMGKKYKKPFKRFNPRVNK